MCHSDNVLYPRDEKLARDRQAFAESLEVPEQYSKGFDDGVKAGRAMERALMKEKE